MISTLLFVCFVAVMFCTMSFLGNVHPLHPTESYLLVGVSVMVVEAMLALVLARGFVKILVAGKGGSDRLRRICAPVLLLIPTATVPTVAILYINQMLDRGPSIEQTLPVTRTYTEVSRGNIHYYAVVPPPRWISSSGTEDDIRLPWGMWRRLVPGQSMLTFTVHPGRFGLLWYDVASATNHTKPPI